MRTTICPIVISGKAQHGKDTFADTCMNMDKELQKKLVLTEKLAFADSLKIVAKTLLWDGKKDERGRTLLQWLGDGARQYDPDVWIKKWHESAYIKAHVDEEKFKSVLISGIQFLFVPDCRYLNELISLKKMYGGRLTSVRVNRINYTSKLTLEQQSHPSETDLDTYEGFDFVIQNDDLETYRKNCISIYSNILAKQVTDLIHGFETWKSGE